MSKILETMDNVIILPNNVWEKLYDDAKDLGKRNENIIISGNRGSGKTELARYITCFSPVSPKLFVLQGHHINMMKKSDALLEILGNYKKSVFSEDRMQHSLMDRFHDGSIILEDIELFPLDFQKSLYIVMKDKFIQDASLDRVTHGNIRFIATTCLTLKQITATQTIDKDLKEHLLFNFIKMPVITDTTRVIFSKFYYSVGRAYGYDYEVTENGAWECVNSPLLKTDNLHILKKTVERVNKKIKKRDYVDTAERLGELLAKRIKPFNSSDFYFSISIDNIEKDILLSNIVRTDSNIEEIAKIMNVNASHIRYLIKKYGIK